MDELPVVDVSGLVRGADDLGAARELDRACRELGFFYVVGHGVDPALEARLESAAHELFALPEEAKQRIAMAHGGRAWRGWFPLHGELTSGRPDEKEGVYFGAELPAGDARPLHGPNLFPGEVPELRTAVLEWLDAMTALGQAILRGVGLGLGLSGSWFAEHLTGDPLVLFRIFRYPPHPPAARDDEGSWGVAEHTDYGLLTILRQDRSGGLEVRSGAQWLSAPPIEGSYVCNLGDMLERLTGGRYRSTPHRVRNLGSGDRLSFPFFLDPGWDTEVVPLPLDVTGPAGPPPDRWDGTDVVAGETGTYGAYLMGKIGKVFPELGSTVL
jgi:isopenicillin N synthase-like dioxygenase